MYKYKIELHETKTNGCSRITVDQVMTKEQFKDLLGNLALSYDSMNYLVDWYDFERFTQVSSGDYLKESARLYVDYIEQTERGDQ